MTITAHAGSMGTAPNTLKSIKACIMAASIIEVDVRFLASGVPVLAHDEKQKEEGTLLEDCLALISESEAHINLDLKERSNIPGIAALVRQFGLKDRAFFTGVEVGGIDYVKESGLAYYLNCMPRRTGKHAAMLVNTAKELGCVGLNMNYRLCSKKLKEEARMADLLVSVWTVDKAPAMRKMMRLGVDNITTRRPDICEELRHAI